MTYKISTKKLKRLCKVDKKIILPLLLIVFLCIAIFLFLFENQNLMTIRELKTKKLLYQTEIDDDFDIEFSYIHSVSNTPICETLRVNKDGFYLLKVEYIDQGGAGMPEFAFDNQEFLIEDGKFIIQGFDRFFETIVINVQQKYQDNIKTPSDNVDLDKLLKSDGQVILDVENKLVFKFLHIF